MATKEKDREESKAEAKDHSRKSADEKEIVVGKDPGITVDEQAKKARGEDEEKLKKADEATFGNDKEAEKLFEEAFPERKAINLRVEGNLERNEKLGINRNLPASKFKVELSDEMKGEKLYQGRLTLQSVHGETHEKISFPVVEDVARGEDYLWYVMKNAHPHAIREHFEIDAENTSDPNLRTRYE
jgi:hypothetical protein